MDWGLQPVHHANINNSLNYKVWKVNDAAFQSTAKVVLILKV